MYGSGVPRPTYRGILGRQCVALRMACICSLFMGSSIREGIVFGHDRLFFRRQSIDQSLKGAICYCWVHTLSVLCTPVSSDG